MTHLFALPAPRHAPSPSDSDLRAQYERFCADLKRNMPPVEAEFNGMPSFNEWKEALGYA